MLVAPDLGGLLPGSFVLMAALLPFSVFSRPNSPWLFQLRVQLLGILLQKLFFISLGMHCGVLGVLFSGYVMLLCFF